MTEYDGRRSVCRDRDQKHAPLARRQRPDRDEEGTGQSPHRRRRDQDSVALRADSQDLVREDRQERHRPRKKRREKIEPHGPDHERRREHDIANQAQADLFVSVHANYSDFPSARGVETYYSNSFMVSASKDVDMRPDAGGARNAATESLSPADLQERVEQSRRLAVSVQRSLYGTLSAQNPGLRDRGIKVASFVVLTESAMPGILAEVSFVSSLTDEQKLRSDGYREQIAEALYKGIARYAASSHGIQVASARR